MSFEVTDEILQGPWGAAWRAAHDLLECVCETLRCSAFGVPERATDCGHQDEDDNGEACKAVLHGSTLRTMCCGFIAVGIGDLFWHDGQLNSIAKLHEFDACRTVAGPSWGVELNIAVLRCASDMAGWGGQAPTPQNPIQGLADPREMSDMSAVFSADQLAIMLAQEMCFENSDAVVTKGRNVGVVPANVSGYRHSAICRGNIVGWGRNRAMKVHLNDQYNVCAEDCIALAERLGL